MRASRSGLSCLSKTTSHGRPAVLNTVRRLSHTATLKDVLIGPRNMHSEPLFNPYLQATAQEVADELEVPLKQGNYCFTSGPTFESPHDIKILRKLGGQAVGMSTVP